MVERKCGSRAVPPVARDRTRRGLDDTNRKFAHPAEPSRHVRPQRHLVARLIVAAFLLMRRLGRQAAHAEERVALVIGNSAYRPPAPAPPPAAATPS